jgi:hypothetical protein
MPINQIEAIAYANQNTQVAATKQSDHRNRIQKQDYEAVIRSTQKESEVDEVGAAAEDQKIEDNREHNREQAEKETKEKEVEIKLELKKKDKEEIKEDSELPYRILDIKV